ncbi:MAG: 30S ribosomal protein S17 [Chloroflexota bacterium]
MEAASPAAGAERRSKRKQLVGWVVSNKMDKTITVDVERLRRHPRYKRVVRVRKKFYAHDPFNLCQVGDLVRIEESRPLSRLKRWRLVEIISRAGEAAAQAPAPTELPATPEAEPAAEPAPESEAER